MVDTSSFQASMARHSEDAVALPVGTLLDDLEIERVLRTSACGVVYVALDRVLELRIAVKEYLPAALGVRGADGRVGLRSPLLCDAFERGRAAFIAEARVLAGCDHPSLLRVQRVWEANGTVLRAMPYYPGQNLVALRQGMARAPDETTLRAWLDALLGALETLHGAGHVHGDVSPANTLLLPNDRPLLLDFGATRRSLEAIASRAVPAAAPVGEPQGVWSDLNGLAALMRYCISGDLPELGREAGERAPEALPHSLLHHYSKPLRETLEALQAARPGHTPADATACRALLQRRPALHAVGAGGAGIEPPPVLLDEAVESDREPSVPLDGADAKFFAELDQVIAVTAQRAKRPDLPARLSTNEPTRPAREATRRRSASHRTAWGVTAMLALAIGAAGWQFSERTVASPPQQFAAALAPGGAAPDPTAAPQRRLAAAEAPAAPEAPEAARAPKTRPAPATAAPPVDSVAAPEARGAVRGAASPREECGSRTEFALYRCLKSECEQPRWQTHPQCLRLRATDEVD